MCYMHGNSTAELLLACSAAVSLPEKAHRDVGKEERAKQKMMTSSIAKEGR